MHIDVCKGEITWHLGFVLKEKFDNFEFVYWECTILSAFDMSENSYKIVNGKCKL